MRVDIFSMFNFEIITASFVGSSSFLFSLTEGRSNVGLKSKQLKNVTGEMMEVL